MSAAQQAKAKRRMHANKFAAWPKRKRPNYKMRDLVTSQRHEARLRETARRMQQTNKKGK